MKLRLINRKIISISLILMFAITMAQFVFVTNTVMAATIILPPGSTSDDLQLAVSNSSSGDIIVISSDITLSLGVYIGADKEVTIQSTTGNNWKLIRNQQSQFHFNVPGKLTLQNITIEGGNTGGKIYINGGEVTLNNNAIIQNCFSQDVGGGVSVSGGKLVMNGNSAIENCYARIGGGGIYVSQGTLVMNDESSIKNCYLTTTTTSVGGGVNVYRSTFTMNDSSVITECLSELNGGGVFVNESFFDMNSGSITKNTANLGGGIYIHDGEVVIGNAIISENIVDGNGGGIYLANEGNLEITGDTSIINNSASNGNGGGIYAENTKYENLITESGTQFSNNVSYEEMTPPSDAQILYPNIKFSSTSIFDHPLNNHDINYSTVYSMKYDANGGTGEYTISDIEPGSIKTILSVEDTGIERQNYRFIEWNTEQDGSGTIYQVGDSVTVDSDIVLYAQWENKTEYDVKFESNGGSYIESQTIPIGETITKPDNPMMVGYIFEGWYTDDETFENEWDFNAPVMNDLTLYAKWTEDPNYKPCECKCIILFIIFMITIVILKICMKLIKCRCDCKKIKK